MSNADTVLIMFIAIEIFKILSPVTICLQSQNIYYGTIPTVVKTTTSKLDKLRTDEEWQAVLSKVAKFITDHGIQPIPPQRCQKRKRFMDELTIDEAPPFEKIKVNVYLNILDSLRVQLQDRYPQNSLKVVMQMTYFSHEGILAIASNSDRLHEAEIANLCEQYGIDE